MAVDRVIGGVEVQHDPIRRHGMGLEEQVDEEALDGSCTAGDLLVPAILVGPDRGQFRRLSVLLPANALPLSRLRTRDCPVGSRLPTMVANKGSCRRSSWSLRSS